MKLFSWFMKNKDMTPYPLVSTSSVENTKISTNTMWPVAHPRNSTKMNQKLYINKTLSLSDKKVKQAPLNMKNI